MICAILAYMHTYTSANKVENVLGFFLLSEEPSIRWDIDYQNLLTEGLEFYIFGGIFIGFS